MAIEIQGAKYPAPDVDKLTRRQVDRIAAETGVNIGRMIAELRAGGDQVVLGYEFLHVLAYISLLLTGRPGAKWDDIYDLPYAAIRFVADEEETVDPTLPSAETVTS